MIEVDLFYYAESDTRFVRFSKKVKLAAIPFPGATIRIKGDNLKVEDVIFIDGGRIEVLIDNEELNIMPDSELPGFIDDMKSESGWVMESNVKRRR